VKPDGITVEITAKPGMLAVLGVYVAEGKGTPVGADGTVRLTMPRKDWKNYDGNSLQVACEKRSLFGREGGSTTVPLGAPTRAFDRIPKDADPWFAVLAGSSSAAGADLRLEIDDEKSPISTWVTKGENTFSLVVAATPGAEVDLAGKTYEIESTGVSELEIPARNLWLGVRTDTLGGNKMRSDLAWVVRSGKKDEAEGVLKLSIEQGRGKDRVVKELRAIPDGTTFPATFGKVVDATLLVTYDDLLYAVGPDTKVGLARWVAIERNTVRKGGDCVYDLFTRTRKHDDVEVHVYDARSGKQVAVKKFALDDEVECPMFATRSDTFEWREKVENVTAWLEKASKAGWK
jgi:hypothetical protein